jgi:hypothetical protein
MFLSKKSKIQYFNEIEKKLELLIKKRNEFTNKVILSNTTTNMLVWCDKSSIHQDFFDQVISVCDFVIKLKIKEPNIVLINGIKKIYEGNLIQYWYDMLAKEYEELSKSKISLFKKEDYYIVEKFYNNYCK